VQRFMSLLKKNYTTHKMVSDYARELCLTPSHLNKIVKKVSGFPASYHIQQQIILEAKRQAIYYGLSMKEVAFSLGFDDYLHFSKFFKNNSGMNFTHFKSMVLTDRTISGAGKIRLSEA
jgi:AraC-like DNA-binding protein